MVFIFGSGNFEPARTGGGGGGKAIRFRGTRLHWRRQVKSASSSPSSGFGLQERVGRGEEGSGGEGKGIRFRGTRLHWPRKSGSRSRELRCAKGSKTASKGG